MPSATDEMPQRLARRSQDAKTTEKYNACIHVKSDSDTTNKHRSRKPSRNNGLEENNENIAISISSSNEDAALIKFHDAIAVNSSASLWKRHATLAEQVVRASQFLCQKTISSLLLEDHTAELLSTCRTLVKEATETKSSRETLQLLYVAIHGLRAISPLLEELKKVEATMKILYHAVTTASDACVKSKDTAGSVEAVSLCLAAFQALGYLLNGYKVQVDGKTILSFKWKMSKTPSDMFPLPILSSGNSVRIGTMAVKQVYKIAMQATYSTESALAHVYIGQIRKKSTVTSIANEFGPFTTELVQHTTSYDKIIQFAQEVIIPWTCTLSSQELATKDNMEDSLAYAKRMFRLLFDVASRIDRCILTSSKSDSVSPADSLILRKQAIMTFLLSSKDMPVSRNMQSAMRKHHWESACTYACKASVAYRQQLSKVNRRVAHDAYLDEFHKDVGRVLDSYATIDSLCYVEYCAYRAFYSSRSVAECKSCESKDCVFEELGFCFQHNNCSLISDSSSAAHSSGAAAGHATLAVIFLILNTQSELDELIHGRRSRDCRQADLTSDFHQTRSDIVANFHSVFTETASVPPYDVMNRCYKLLELLGLSRKVYHILSNDFPDCASSAALIALETAGRVLSECIGPLAASLIRSGNDPSKQQQLWELAVDSYSRGLAVFDKVREQQLARDILVCDKISCHTDDALCALFTLCHDGELASHRSQGTLEKVAKTIFAIGRARRDRTEYDQALLPLCLGNDLFSELADLQGPETVKDSQLSMRFSHLAFTFSSLDMPEEACLGLVLAILYDVIGSVTSDQAEHHEEPIHFLRELSALTSDVVLMDVTSESRGGRRSLINRLVSLSETFAQKYWSLPGQTTGEDFVLSARRVLRDSAGFESHDDDEPSADPVKPDRFSIATILSSAFRDNKLIRILKKTRMSSVRKEQVLTIATVVVEQGGMLQQAVSGDQNDSTLVGVQMKEFNRSVQFAEWLSKSVFHEDDDASHGLVALIHILAAASLASSSAPGLPDVLKKPTELQPSIQVKGNVLLLQANKLMSKTTEMLRSTMGHARNEEQRLLLSVLLVCAYMYSSEISSEVNIAIVSVPVKNEILSHAREAIQLLLEPSTICDEMRASFRMCLTRTLTRFQDTVNLEGDKLEAAQAAVLVARIHDGAGNGDEKWYSATAGNLLREAGLNVTARDFLNGTHSQNQVTLLGSCNIQVNNLSQLELSASILRTEVNSLEVHAFKSAATEIQDLFDKCNEILGQPETEPFTRVILSWICCSCTIALAEGFESWGSPDRALKYQRMGISLCRESISSLRKLRNHSNLAYNGDCISAWAEIALSTFFLRVTERRTTIQRRIATLCARMGDHRRSEAYAVGAVKECLPGGHDMVRQRLKISELASIDRSELHTICQSACYRLLLDMKAKASSSDRVLESLHGTIAFDSILTETQVNLTADRVAWQIENIKNLINAGDLHYISANDPDKRFKEYYLTADCETKALMTSSITTSLLSSFSCRLRFATNSQIFGPLCTEVKLRRARVLLADPSRANQRAASNIFDEITETVFAPAQCRAWAHYYLGLIHVRAARQTGALHDLWADFSSGASNLATHRPDCDREGQHAIASARSHLRATLALVGPASDALVRDAMRTLAVLAGPSRRDESIALSAASLTHSSIGATTRQVVTNALATHEEINSSFDASHRELNFDEKLYNLFGSLETPWSELPERNERINALFGEAGKSLPSNCRIVAVALCPTGEILVTSMSSSSDQPLNLGIETACIFPDSNQDSILDDEIYNNVMKPLDELIRLNEDQIRGLDTTTVADNFKEEPSKRDWWNDRQRADDQLQSLVENVESKYFSAGCVRRVFLGDDDVDDISITCGNLASKFEEACSVDDSTDDDAPLQDDLHSMTVNQLKDELEKLHVHVTTRKKPTKKQLIDMVTEARATDRDKIDHPSEVTSNLDEKCVILILDENLHRFPFEGMEVCSNWAASRVPSLPFAIAPLIQSAHSGKDTRGRYPVVEPAEASYIVDPEGNLAQTKNRLVPAISDICESNDWNWKSVIGTLPSKDFVQHALVQRNGLLLYCGHGGSTFCFSRSQVESLMKNDGNPGTRRCQSTIILMGCSSGKLVSVNRKDSKITDKVTMFYEPEGIALSYLCAGAHCVVANLWDVTDRDIDRYCITLLETFLANNEGQSLAKCVAEARSSCKMRHIVGLAPVCYGLPVHLSR